MVTNNHYRWDFIGLSTDVKPTPATSEKVVDGSTFYCADNSKLYVYCTDNWYERKALGGGGGGSYTAGNGIDITDDTISVDTTVVQEKLTAGNNITISDNTISATGGGDTVYSDKSTSNVATGGAVYIGNLNANQEEQPDPTQTDEHHKYFWALPGANNFVPGQQSVNILGNNSSAFSTAVGSGANVSSLGIHSVAVGEDATVHSQYGVSIGSSSYLDSNKPYSVALGARAIPTRSGEVNIGTGSQAVGYNSTTYRVLGGVHDPVDAHDAATKGYVDTHSGGGAIHVLTTADNNYDSGTGNLDSVALWLLPTGIYSAIDTSNINVWVGVNPNDSELVDGWGLILISNAQQPNDSAFMTIIAPGEYASAYEVAYNDGEIISGV